MSSDNQNGFHTIVLDSITTVGQRIIDENISVERENLEAAREIATRQGYYYYRIFPSNVSVVRGTRGIVTTAADEAEQPYRCRCARHSPRKQLELFP